MPTSPILFLAEVSLRVTTYMGDDGCCRSTHRLVEGLNEFDARQKVEHALTVDDRYGTSVECICVELHPVIR